MKGPGATGITGPMITRTHTKGDAPSTAIYSPCERYRYSLTRVWDEQGRVLAQTVCLKTGTGENNHSRSLDLERVPIRGKLLVCRDDKEAL